MADEAVAQSVDHVEEGIEMGNDLGRLGQPLDGIEGPRQEGQRRTWPPRSAVLRVPQTLQN